MDLIRQLLREWLRPLGALLVLLLLAACTTVPQTPGLNQKFTAAKGCKDIAILLPETGPAPRWEGSDRPELERGFAERLPGVTFRYFNANGDPKKQEEQADLALEKGSCILVVSPSDSQKASTIVQKAKAKAVPVIAYDRWIEDDDLAFYISFDSEEVGKIQVQYIAKQFNLGAGGPYNLQSGANLVIIGGAEEDNNAKLLRDGALKELQPLIDAKKLNLVFDEFIPGWDGATAAQKMKDQLEKSDNNIQIALVANDNMANEVIKVILDKKMAVPVLVTGQDGSLNSIKNILKGHQAMTVYKKSKEIAAITAQLVKDFSESHNTASSSNGDRQTKNGVQINSYLKKPLLVDISNIKDTVIADGTLKIEDVCQNLPKGTGGICP